MDSPMSVLVQRLKALIALIVIAVYPFTIYWLDLELSHSPHGILRHSLLYSHNSSSNAASMSHQQESACFLILCRNSDLGEMLETIEQLEARFNTNYNYPYVFLNDELFTDEFKMKISKAVSGPVEFGIVPIDHWSVPPTIDPLVLQHSFDSMKSNGVLYGDKLSYHLMCRFYSGFFYKHPLTLKYDYYWRIEPGVSFLCDIPYDPFAFMRANGKIYGFVISLIEMGETIPSLWKETVKFMTNYSEFINPTANSIHFLTKLGGMYSKCHFWSNFEIASFDFFRSKEYNSYFQHLDSVGGFFHERWGDAPVHSLAVGMFLSPNQVHYFEDIGYKHPPSQYCPQSLWNRKCDCNASDIENNFYYASGSCSAKWIKTIREENFPHIS